MPLINEPVGRHVRYPSPDPDTALYRVVPDREPRLPESSSAVALVWALAAVVFFTIGILVAVFA